MADSGAPLDRVLVIIPTYNESENIRAITGRLRAAVPSAHILIADDNSPDGTGAIADELAEADDHIHVLHRAGKQGLGAAYVAGFRWGLDEGYDVLVEHDADGSHQPEQLPLLLERLKTADAVKGSRWVKGGSVVNWPKSREILSRGGNLWTRLMLGIPVKDATGGFTAWRAATLRGIDLDGVEAAGYGFQVDLAWRAIKNGFTVAEVPIEFVEREFGDSKMDTAIVVEALALTTQWGLKHRWGQVRGAATKAGLTKENANKVADEAGRVAKEAGRTAGEVTGKAVAGTKSLIEELKRSDAAKTAGDLTGKAVAGTKSLVLELKQKVAGLTSSSTGKSGKVQ